MTNAEIYEAMGRKLRASPRLGRLHAKQREFLAVEHRECLIGGAAGGGKTEALLADAIAYAHHPHYRALILRRSYPELAKPGAIMDRAIRWLGREFWNETAKRFTFASGAILQFGYVDGPADLEQYKSSEFHRIYIDELTAWSEADYVYLFSRCRKNKGDPVPLAMRAGTNPDGIGAEWVRLRFGIPDGKIPETDEERAALRESPKPIEHTDPRTGARRLFLPARAEDNPTLDLEAYDAQLRELGEATYWQLRFGLWVRNGEGLVYGLFDATRDVIAEAPEGITNTILAQDFGTTSPTSWTILGWRPNDPCVYALRSFKLPGIIPSENAEMVERLQALWHFHTIVGDEGGLGKAYAEEARRRFLLPFRPAQKEGKLGFIKLLNGEFSRGRLKIVRAECAELIHELNTLPWKPKTSHTVEAPGFANHCTDGLLYGWREASAYTNKPIVAPTSADEARRQELDAFFAKDAARLKRQRETEWWDDGAGPLEGMADE
jgi:Terminase large subunit, T4likevirus-type, N-terminal